MLRFTDVSYEYQTRNAALQALGGLSFAVEEGDSLVIIGPSGCGKSTALLLACGLLQPSGGEVLVAGRPLDAPRQSTALILQDFGLLPWKTVLQNAALGLEIRKVARRERENRARAALQSVGLGDFLQAFPRELSGGMRQRLALARALALDVSLICMDEPLSAVDTMLRESLQDLLLVLWHERGYTSLLVTHSIEEAVFLGRRILVLSARPGRLSALIDNPGMGTAAYRGDAAFYAKCSELRRALAGEGDAANKGNAVEENGVASKAVAAGKGAFDAR
ncbi:MAG: ATP-binding cassette domain-containing protein [Coriobacteriales bacterium]|jgi:NitT/TauT family transport system ATP-binding protein|nr:ATP-binding cassette domain-containing protein [Coriobacteriales bacterium]